MDHLLEQTAPLFTMPAVIPKGGIEEINLEKMIGKNKWLVLFFYPGNFAIETPAYITILSDRYEEFRQRKTEVVAISTDTVYAHTAWTGLDRKDGGVGPIRIPLASDRNLVVSTAYKVLNQEQGMPMKVVFIIDPVGKVRYIKQYRRQIHYNIDELLLELSNLQYRS